MNSWEEVVIAAARQVALGAPHFGGCKFHDKQACTCGVGRLRQLFGIPDAGPTPTKCFREECWAVARRRSPIDNLRVCETDYRFEKRNGRERTNEEREAAYDKAERNRRR